MQSFGACSDDITSGFLGRLWLFGSVAGLVWNRKRFGHLRKNVMGESHLPHSLSGFWNHWLWYLNIGLTWTILCCWFQCCLGAQSQQVVGWGVCTESCPLDYQLPRCSLWSPMVFGINMEWLGETSRRYGVILTQVNTFALGLSHHIPKRQHKSVICVWE